VSFHIPKLTPKEMSAAERDEWNTQVVREAVGQAKELGHGSMSHSEVGSKSKATYAQLADTKEFTASRKGCLTPAHLKLDGGRVVAAYFTPADYGALVAGRFCPRCWELQEEPALPEWARLGDPKPCMSVVGRGCGWPKGWEFAKRLPYRIEQLSA